MAEIQSLARALKILDLLADSPQGIGTTELAGRLNIDKSSASRLLQTLMQYGYAEQDGSTRRYHLGPHVVTIGRRLLGRMPLRDAARPYLKQLVAETGECAHLAIATRGQALYIDQEESTEVLRVDTGIGTLAPLHCTALGKVFLTWGDAPIPYDTTLERFTPRTLTDVRGLRAHLEQARAQGYTIDDEEYNYGVRCVAAPVYDGNRRLVGALGISGPAGRISLASLDDYGQLVMQVADALSRDL